MGCGAGLRLPLDSEPSLEPGGRVGGCYSFADFDAYECRKCGDSWKSAPPTVPCPPSCPCLLFMCLGKANREDESMTYKHGWGPRPCACSSLSVVGPTGGADGRTRVVVADSTQLKVAFSVAAGDGNHVGRPSHPYAASHYEGRRYADAALLWSWPASATAVIFDRRAALRGEERVAVAVLPTPLL